MKNGPIYEAKNSIYHTIGSFFEDFITAIVKFCRFLYNENTKNIRGVKMGNFKSTCRLCEMPKEPSPFTMCPTCLEDSEKVRNFIVRHPYVSIGQIVEVTHVPIAKVEKLVALGVSKKDNLQTN